MRHRDRHGRRRLAPVGIALVVALAAGELGIRLAARVMPGVRYLAAAGTHSPQSSFASLDDFLIAHSAHLIPHRPWFNYWNNSLGFNDREFEAPKPAGRFRIMALGDSFAYGLVPYPDNVLTIVEERLRAECSGCDLDVLNFGIAGTGVEDYTTLIELGHVIYQPDLIVVHFYMGNDGPNSSPARTWDRVQRWLPPSRAANFVRNVWRLWAAKMSSGVRADSRGERWTSSSTAPRAGSMIDRQQTAVSDRDPVMSAPTFSEAAFVDIAGAELLRLYAPANRTARLERAWAPTLALLEKLRRTAADRGSRVAIVLYPSAMQVYSTLRASVLGRLHARGELTDIALDDLEPTTPNRILQGYCRLVNIPCVDVTPALLHASRESPEPLYRPRDTHWNIRGNLVAAEAEAAAIRPIVCRERRPSC